MLINFLTSKAGGCGRVGCLPLQTALHLSDKSYSPEASLATPIPPVHPGLNLLISRPSLGGRGRSVLDRGKILGVCVCMFMYKYKRLRIAHLVYKSVIYFLFIYHVPWMTQHKQTTVPGIQKASDLVGKQDR